MLNEARSATLQARCLHSVQRNSSGTATGRSWKPRRSRPSDRRPSDVPPDEEVATAGSKSNSSRAGPFAGPKPEPMTVPRGATRSNRRAHPSRLGWARGFLPSWPCEFDSRHPLHSIAPSQVSFSAFKLFEQSDNKKCWAGRPVFHDIGNDLPKCLCQPGFRGANRDRLKLITRDAVPNSCPMLRSFGCEKSAERAVLPRAANCMCCPCLLRPGNPDALAAA
jgi:hypothetical protein